MTKKNIKVHEFKIYSIKGKKISQFVEINYTQYSSDIKKKHKMSTPPPQKKEPMEYPGVEGETALPVHTFLYFTKSELTFTSSSLLEAISLSF